MTSDFDSLYIEPLTNREMEVLQLLADGLSNQEIADTLVIEVGTVKWYNRQIYSKLGVNNRKQAVIRAQTLGILEPTTNDPFLRKLHNLPADALPFIGREQEISELITQLNHDTIRLITIFGAGGMGKTRLSIEVGRRLLPRFLQGVYFISLAPVTSTEQIITTIADVIGFKFHSDMQPKQQLLTYLSEQNMLLIIDNFEHLLDSAGLLTDILKIAPNIKLLVTSRETLNLSSEVLYPIRGLSIPPEEIKKFSTEYDSVKLFIEASQRRNVVIAEADIKSITNICQKLGGMPLAILLAAAWVDTLSLDDILAEIKASIEILEVNLRDTPSRHQSIETVFDYSWKELSEYERNVFMKLSVFRDGFTREAAQAVTGASIRDLQRLVHTSFIQHQPSGRYTIHELMRQYGEQKLNETDEMEIVQEKHAQFFADFTTPLGKVIWLTASPSMLQAVDSDFENVRAAWSFRFEQRDVTGLSQFLGGIWHYCDQYSRSQEAIGILEPVLEVFQENDRDDIIYLRGYVICLLSWFYGDSSLKSKGLELSKKSIIVLRRLGIITPPLLQAYLCQSIMHFFNNNLTDTLDTLMEGYKLSCEIDDHQWKPNFMSIIGECYVNLGQYEEAHSWFEKSSKYHAKLGMSGGAYILLGEYTKAEQVFLEALNVAAQHRYSYLSIYGELIKSAVLMDNLNKAWRYLHHGLQYADDQFYTWATLAMMTDATTLFITEHQWDTAVKILSLVIHHESAIEATKAQALKSKDTLQSRLPRDEFEAAWERGKYLDLSDVITELMER